VRWGFSEKEALGERRNPRRLAQAFDGAGRTDEAQREAVKDPLDRVTLAFSCPASARCVELARCKLNTVRGSHGSPNAGVQRPGCRALRGAETLQVEHSQGEPGSSRVRCNALLGGRQGGSPGAMAGIFIAAPVCCELERPRADPEGQRGLEADVPANPGLAVSEGARGARGHCAQVSFRAVRECPAAKDASWPRRSECGSGVFREDDTKGLG
jgi:hypothetical protein